MKIAVIGGGPAGMMAAIFASNAGADVTLLEKNEKLGKKLYISGKGRCNLTNSCTIAEFLQNVVTNPKFLQGALHRFSPQSTLDFCAECGLPLKVERGNRVFPQSDKSSDVIKTFQHALINAGVTLQLNTEVTSVTHTADGFLLKTSQGNQIFDNQIFDNQIFDNQIFDKVIVATGGYSYRATGSDGFGYTVARSFGHTVTPLKPALCRILCSGTQQLMGLSLKNVTVSFVNDGKVVASQFGEMLFTDDGVSGPAVLTLSSLITALVTNPKNHLKNAQISIDLKPALNADVLNERVLRDFQGRMNKNFENALDDLLPARLTYEVVRQTGISPTKKVNQVSATERQKVVNTLKNLVFPFVALDDVNGGIVTSGGVDVQEIDPKTMQSKLQTGLYFVGEVLDVDALTGGFNIQIALSTGYACGMSVSGMSTTLKE